MEEIQDGKTVHKRIHMEGFVMTGCSLSDFAGAFPLLPLLSCACGRNAAISEYLLVPVCHF